MPATPPATITVRTSNSTRPVLDLLLPGFEKASGHKVELVLDTAKNSLARIEAGERADVAVLLGLLTGVDTRDRAAARAHRVNIQHRNADGKSVNDRFGRLPRRTVRQANIRRRSAHIEAKNLAESTSPSHFDSRDSAARGTREHGADRVPSRLARG